MKVCLHKSKAFLTTSKIRLYQLLDRLGVDRATGFGILGKVWGAGAGPVTVLLIATQFSPELQGYYYTFATILALQVFVELGLGTVIIQFTSHEWSKLSFDHSGSVRGNKDALSRLISIARIASRWYLVGGIVLTLGLGSGGYIFFSGSQNWDINWVNPWLTLCLLTGLTICLVPIWSLLEGCNQVSTLYTFRFFLGVLNTLSIWMAILLGAKLWTASISSFVGLIFAGFFLQRRYRTFLRTLFFSRPTGARVYWRTNMLPMQWRIALSWMSGYFVFSFFTPVLFKYHGPVVAGQMGMTWSLLGVMGIASSWLNPRVPQFGIFIAQGRYGELDQLFWKITKIVMAVSALLAASIFVFVWCLNWLKIFLADRLLPLLPTGLFVLSQILFIVSLPFSAYLRAHKKEPLMFLSVLAAAMNALATLILGKYYSATGMAVGYLLVNLIIIPLVIVVWQRCRTDWHGKTV